MTAAEFSHIIRIDTLKRDKENRVKLRATPEECAGLAARFDIPGVERLEADLVLTLKTRDEALLTGEARAKVTQPCVVTLDPVTSDLAFPVRVRFVPERLSASASAELDIDGQALADEDDEDIESYGGGTLDLGEVVVQQLGINLPLYPRAKGADWQDRQFAPGRDQVLDESLKEKEEAEEHPFAKLAALKKDDG